MSFETAVRVELALARGVTPISGRLRRADGGVRAFVGWLALIQLLDAAVADEPRRTEGPMQYHYGTFSSSTDLNTTRARAVAAIRTVGGEIWNDPAGEVYFVLGLTAVGTVTVVLVPEGDQVAVAVVADSVDDSAEALRNRVRELIQHAPTPAPIPHLP